MNKSKILVRYYKLEFNKMKYKFNQLVSIQQDKLVSDSDEMVSVNNKIDPNMLKKFLYGKK